MKIIKYSKKETPKISLILLDWSVRESFHLLYYLKKQTIPQNLFEVIVIEYYSTKSNAINPFEERVDSWILLEMSNSCYYHKHLMYNVGIVLAKGEIIIICDSDAMAKPTFLESILEIFNKDPNAVLHLDQFRNNRRDLYPFCYPSFEEVAGHGCINYQNAKTKGVCVNEDRIHRLNYGACFCARRDSLIKIGGADEHIDFIGHICGPYDMTFRLRNLGYHEIWHPSEFLYHTWHPGQAGENNYLGPHDGRGMSTTALESLVTKRIEPHVKNPAIAMLQQNGNKSQADLINVIILKDHYMTTESRFLKSKKSKQWARNSYQIFLYRNFMITQSDFGFNIEPLMTNVVSSVIKADNLKDAQKSVDRLHKKTISLFLLLIMPMTMVIRLCQRIFSQLITLLSSKFLANSLPYRNSSLHNFNKQKFKLSTFVRILFQIKPRLKNLFFDICYYQNNIKGLVTHLSYLKKSKIEYLTQSILIVHSRVDYVFFKLFILLHVIPRLEIAKLSVSNSHLLEQIIQKNKVMPYKLITTCVCFCIFESQLPKQLELIVFM